MWWCKNYYYVLKYFFGRTFFQVICEISVWLETSSHLFFAFHFAYIAFLIYYFKVQFSSRNSVRWIVTWLRPLKVQYLYATARKALLQELHATAKFHKHLWRNSAKVDKKLCSEWKNRRHITPVTKQSDRRLRAAVLVTPPLSKYWEINRWSALSYEISPFTSQNLWGSKAAGTKYILTRIKIKLLPNVSVIKLIFTMSWGPKVTTWCTQPL